MLEDNDSTQHEWSRNQWRQRGGRIVCKGWRRMSDLFCGDTSRYIWIITVFQMQRGAKGWGKNRARGSKRRGVKIRYQSWKNLNKHRFFRGWKKGVTKDYTWKSHKDKRPRNLERQSIKGWDHFVIPFSLSCSNLPFAICAITSLHRRVNDLRKTHWELWVSTKIKLRSWKKIISVWNNIQISHEFESSPIFIMKRSDAFNTDLFWKNHY